MFLAAFLFSPCTICHAETFTPFTSDSKYACTELSNGKPAIGVKRGNGYGITVNFAGVKSTLKEIRKKYTGRRAALFNLLEKLQNDKNASKSLLKEFYKAYEDAYNQAAKNLSDDEKITAIQSLIPRANSLVDGVGVELAALQACKAKKAPSGGSGLTYKVFVTPIDGTSIIVIATTSAKGIDPNQIYCAEVPNLFTGGTSFVSGRLFPNPCSPRGCAEETGAGNVGLLITGLFSSSTETRDENLGTYQATYNGTLSIRKIKEGEPCQ